MTGFSFIHNAVQCDYPIVEAIQWKYKLKLWIEKYTGYLIFEYKNYRII
ncbi:MAG: hypothetical protein LBR08_12355 [Bacteroidales bacterium]|nr:hypothetical protein [Bacteroidales bacterium]